jgi:hypothetical protein
MGTMGNDDDDDDEWLDGSVGGGGGSIRMLGPAVEVGKTMAMRLATPPSKEASRFAKPRSAHRAQLELPTATASAGAATHVSRTDIMVVQATEVLDDDAEALVVTRTVSTKPKLGVYGAGAYKDECWSLQAYQKRVYAIRESYKVFLRGTGIENPGLDDRVCNLLSSIARLVGKQAVHVPDALIPKQVAALVQAADPKNRKLVLSAAMIAKGVCDTNRSKQESLLDHKDFRIELDEKGVMRGVSSKVGVTKTDRLQLGSTQQLRCTDDCDGKGVKFDAQGRFDASLLCPAHLLLYAQELTVDELGRGVSVEMLGDCPFEFLRQDKSS